MYGKWGLLLLFLLLLLSLFFWPVCRASRSSFSPGPLGPLALIIRGGGALLRPRSGSRLRLLLLDL